MRTNRVAGAPVFAALAAALAGVVAATWLTASGSPVPGLAAPGPLVEYGVAVARVLLELGATAVLGLALVPTLVGAARDPGKVAVFGLADRLALVASGLWFGGALGALVLRTAELRPGEPVTIDAVAGYVRAIGAGQALVVSAAAAVVCAILSVLSIASLPRAVLAAAGLLPLVYTGHAAGASTPWHTVTADLVVLHVLAAAAWTGGLVAVLVLLAPRPALLAWALPRFSRLAAVCLATIAFTGACNAVIELATTPGAKLPAALLTSDYGLIVLAKAACLLAIAAIGWRMRFRLLPAIVRHHRTALLGWGVCEVALLGLAFGLAVALGRSAVL